MKIISPRRLLALAITVYEEKPTNIPLQDYLGDLGYTNIIFSSFEGNRTVTVTSPEGYTLKSGLAPHPKKEDQL